MHAMGNKTTTKARLKQTVYSSGISTSPESMPSITSWAGWPSTVHPTLWAVPKTSFTPFAKFFESDLCRSCLATSIISSRVTFPLCLTFFSFFLSLGGSICFGQIGTWMNMR